MNRVVNTIQSLVSGAYNQMYNRWQNVLWRRMLQSNGKTEDRQGVMVLSGVILEGFSHQVTHERDLSEASRRGKGISGRKFSIWGNKEQSLWGMCGLNKPKEQQGNYGDWSKSEGDRAGMSNSFSPGATSASRLPSKGRNNFRTV